MVRVITDSTSSIPTEIRKDLDIEVLSLIINRGGREFIESETDLDVFYQDIYEMADDIPTSSQPQLTETLAVLKRIAKAGEDVLGIFISSKMSGTFESFLQIAKSVQKEHPSFKFAAIDSMTNCMEMGWPVIAAAQTAKAGGRLEECVASATNSLRSTRFVFAPESLLFLEKGGRIGRAAALIGSIISITPVLTVKEGEAGTLAKCRSKKKALDKMIQVLESDISSCGLKNLVVHYIGSKAPAEKWAKKKVAPLLGFAPRVVPASPVIGVHVGPAMGLAYECLGPIPGKFQGRGPEVEMRTAFHGA